MKHYTNRMGVEYTATEFQAGVGWVRLERSGFSVAVKITDLLAWEDGVYAQNAFPYLNADQREFLITGMTPAEFAAAFSEEE